MADLVKQLNKAISVNVPVVSINSEDQFDTLRKIRAGFDNLGRTNPMLVWDCFNSISALNDEGKEAIETLRNRTESDESVGITWPPETYNGMLKVACDYSEPKTIIFMMNSQLFLKEDIGSGGVDPTTIQGLYSIREAFKNKRTLVLLGNSMKMPTLLDMDIHQLVDDLPSEESIVDMAGRMYGRAADAAKTAKDIEFAPFDDKATEKVLANTKGMSKFVVEQSLALSIDLEEKGINYKDLMSRNRAIISDTRGLSIAEYDVSSDSIAGLDNLISFTDGILENGPRAICFIDEIEKTSIAGTGGVDGGGNSTGKDALRALLAYMQDNHVPGIILIGPPGTGKSLAAKVVGNKHQIPTLNVDINDTEGKFVGESEQNMRKLISVVDSVSGSKPLIIATCNSISVLPPELRRRFYLGTFFVDLPNEKERKAIWDLYLKKFNREGEELPKDDFWTGSDIYTCFDLAKRMNNISLIEASKFMVPISISGAGSIEKLRKECDGKYLSANNPGRYVYRKETALPFNITESGERSFDYKDSLSD